MDNFHKIALKSILFKGRDDWYFCFLKSEKIAHVLLLLQESAGPGFKAVAQAGSELPKTICYFAAGEVSPEILLADLFSFQSSLRFATTDGSLSKENASLLVTEYGTIIEKIASGNRPSPFVSAHDFDVPAIEAPRRDFLLDAQAIQASETIKDSYKGQNAIKDIKKDTIVQKDRSEAILAIVKQNKGISIKGISALVKDCSEKTIQRELVVLIGKGLVEKVGERRWSLYVATLGV